MGWTSTMSVHGAKKAQKCTVRVLVQKISLKENMAFFSIALDIDQIP